MPGVPEETPPWEVSPPALGGFTPKSVAEVALAAAKAAAAAICAAGPDGDDVADPDAEVVAGTVSVPDSAKAPTGKHAPGVVVAAPLSIWKQYGSPVDLSYIVIPVGCSAEPTWRLSATTFTKCAMFSAMSTPSDFRPSNNAVNASTSESILPLKAEIVELAALAAESMPPVTAELI